VRLSGQGGLGAVEEPAYRVDIARACANGAFGPAQMLHDVGQRVGPAVEPIAELSLDLRAGGLIGRPKPHPFERQAADASQDGDGEAHANHEAETDALGLSEESGGHLGHRIPRCYSEIALDFKRLLKRGALLAAANWQIVAVQFAAEMTFQVLLAVPIVGAALLVAVLLGGDLANMLQGTLREIFTTIASALMSEPVALVAFIVAFGIVLLGGSILMFLVKGGTVEVLLASESATGAIEDEPIAFVPLLAASRFSLARFTAGCSRWFRRYLVLGIGLMVTYGLSGAGYLAFVIVGYRLAEGRALFIGWTLVVAVSALGLVLWITVVNLLYLLVQIAVAAEDISVGEALRSVTRFIRSEYAQLGGVFLVILVMVVGATLASALAWSGVGLIAFVPLLGLAVFPLQLAGLLLRGLVFEYIGLTALGAYIALYRRYLDARAAVPDAAPLSAGPVEHPA
jgi:hypothetical protein